MTQGSELTHHSSITESDTEEGTIHLLPFLLVLVRRRKMILAISLSTFLLTIGVTLLVPNVYMTTARLIPPQEDEFNFTGALGRRIGNLAALAGHPSGGRTSELYVGLIKSRTVEDKLIDKFELLKIYDSNSLTQAREMLANRVTVSAGRIDGIITIQVEDRDPQRAANLANAMVEELQKLNIQLNLGSATRQRVFLEGRLKVVKADLAQAEVALKDFQKLNKAIRLDEQASAIIEAASRLKGELASKEVELGVQLSSRTERNPDVRALREGISQIRQQLRKLEQSPGGQRAEAEDIFMKTSEVPEIGLQYARLLREYKIQETLFELLTQQYEIAKINESKQASGVQVLDEAIPPDQKSGPRRTVIVIVVTLFGALFSVGLAYAKEYLERMSDEDRHLWREIKRAAGIR
jgi:uncharacterized protein involved in exopolysaccharide biosynthesis